MAEQFLEKLYEYAAVISRLHHIVEYVRVHDDHHAVMTLNEVIPNVCALCRDCVETAYEEGQSLWKQVQLLKEVEGDLILLGDLIETGILPIMERWVQSLAGISVEAEEEHLIESAACGFLTLKNQRTNMYLHSRNNPMEEARKLVESGYDPEKSRYAVYGCGLGYHVYQLYQVSHGSVPITVYERDPRVVEYAKSYGVLDWIPEELLEIVVTEDVLDFLKDVDNEETGILLHLPSIRQIPDEIDREGLLQVYVQQSTMNIFCRDAEINFWRNIQSGIDSVEQIDVRRLKKDMVVVAAGPSLDSSMEFLCSWQGEKTILAVGTVFSKLIKAGIRPDFVMVSDPQSRTLKQIEGLEQETVPMVLDISAYWEFARKYQGPKYLVFVAGSTERISQYAEEQGKQLWTGGGTVTSLAMEFAIQKGAENIFLVGVDLAYPNGVSHAVGTMDYSVKSVAGMQQIPGVRGKTVYTTRVFASYREWIEERIAHTPWITYYNLSFLGARIEGTEELDVQEITHLRSKKVLSPEKQLLTFSSYYQASKEQRYLQEIENVLKTAKADCLVLENARKQLETITFTLFDYQESYEQKRAVHVNLISRWKEQYGEGFLPYIPYEQRNQGSILILTDQFLSLDHAPTMLIYKNISILKANGFQVYLLINDVRLSDEKNREFWFAPVHYNAWEDLYGQGALTYGELEIPYMQVQYSENMEAAVEKVQKYVKEIKPEFIWHIGGTSFLSDIIGECSTLIATGCTNGYAVSQAQVLASYLTIDSEYVKESLSYIQSTGQRMLRFLSPIVNDYAVKDISCSREEYRLPEDKFLICVVGNRLNREITENFLAWMERLADMCKDSIFVIIGDCKRIWKKTRYAERIFYLGYQENLSNVLTCMNLYVNPPRRGGGGSAIAALAAGIPVLTLPGCDVAGGVGGEDFLCQDMEEMLEKALRCYNDKKYYQNMCDKAEKLFRKYAETRSVEKVEKSILQMIEQVREWCAEGSIT